MIGSGWVTGPVPDRKEIGAIMAQNQDEKLKSMARNSYSLVAGAGTILNVPLDGGYLWASGDSFPVV